MLNGKLVRMKWKGLDLYSRGLWNMNIGFPSSVLKIYRNPTLWMKYTEMELKAKNVNRARNLYDRVTATLPRVDVFWYKVGKTSD